MRSAGAAWPCCAGTARFRSARARHRSSQPRLTPPLPPLSPPKLTPPLPCPLSHLSPLSSFLPRQACKGYPSAREGLLVNARFLLGQLEALDGASGHKALKFLDTDFGKVLAKEVSMCAGC